MQNEAVPVCHFFFFSNCFHGDNTVHDVLCIFASVMWVFCGLVHILHAVISEMLSVG